MNIEVVLLFEIVFVVLTLKLIVGRWKPPLQESKQAIVCIVLGTLLGIFANPTREGFVYGIIASGIAFYGGDLLSSFKSIKDDLKDIE